MARFVRGLAGWIMAAACAAAALAQGASEPRFRIGGQAFLPADIIDARAQPAPDGPASILISFEPLAAERLHRLSAAHLGKKLEFTLDGRALIAPIVHDPLPGDTMLISGTFTLDEARAMALAISGKPPLPDSLDESDE